MPYAPLSLCVVTGCPNMVTRGRCPEHELEGRREADKRRPNGYQRGYTTEWAQFRKAYLNDHPLCESARCRELPMWNRTEATDVDHMHGHSRTCAHKYDTQHLQALCHPCHSRKTATVDGGFGHEGQGVRNLCS